MIVTTADCELYKNKKTHGTTTDEEDRDYQIHRAGVTNTREERVKDKTLDQMETLVISFDLENIFTLPKCQVSSFFYKHKLTTYSLTGIVQQTKKTYCSIWSETLSGRNGNDIASALSAILEKVLQDNPAAKHIILWSDSCVPQNRNSHMTYALKCFLKEHTQLLSITHKYCEPGHSARKLTPSTAS